jgi:hypothetical protein
MYSLGVLKFLMRKRASIDFFIARGSEIVGEAFSILGEYLTVKYHKLCDQLGASLQETVNHISRTLAPMG